MGFDMVLQRYFAGVILGLVAAAAYFQASGIKELVGWGVAPGDVAPASSGAPAVVRTHAAQAMSDHATSARSVLDRNPFDSVTPHPLDAVARSDAGAIDREHDAPACEGFRALIVVAASDPTWSMAALSGGGANTTKIVRIGDQLGGKKVQIMEWNRVVLSAGPSLFPNKLVQPRDTPAPPV